MTSREKVAHLTQPFPSGYNRNCRVWLNAVQHVLDRRRHPSETSTGYNTNCRVLRHSMHQAAGAILQRHLLVSIGIAEFCGAARIFRRHPSETSTDCNRNCRVLRCSMHRASSFRDIYWLVVTIGTAEFCGAACIRRHLLETSTGNNRNCRVLRRSMRQTTSSFLMLVKINICFQRLSLQLV